MTLGSNQLFSQSAIRAAKGRTSLVAKMRKRVGWHCTCEIRVRVCFEGGGGGVGGGGQMTSATRSAMGRVEVVSTPCYFDRHAVAGPDSTQPSSQWVHDIIILALQDPAHISNKLSHHETSERERESRDHPLPRVEDRIFCHGETIRISRSCETLKLTLINALRNYKEENRGAYKTTLVKSVA